MGADREHLEFPNMILTAHDFLEAPPCRGGTTLTLRLLAPGSEKCISYLSPGRNPTANLLHKRKEIVSKQSLGLTLVLQVLGNRFLISL